MHERTLQLAGLSTLLVEPESPVSLTVFLLHGYDMRPEDLAPFAHSIGVHARFVVPRGPITASTSGFGWWHIDEKSRDRSRSLGPRDLSSEKPTGLSTARRQLHDLLAVSKETWGDGPTALVGFSQGGMLACDVALRGDLPLAGLALLSASRLALDEWSAHLARVRDLPVLLSHGQRDADLAFAAGEALRDMLATAGARVTWIPHAEGHVIPLIVWRGLRTFLRSLALRADS
ncbi:MAG: hypothetical protein ABI910_09175 [Gemmatimonadota bacterium]